MLTAIVQAYSLLKAGWSRINDLVKSGEPRRPVPAFGSPSEVAAYLQAHAVYVPDPLGGAADWSLHPERLQAAMEAGPGAVRAIPGADCDDWAAWAYAAMRQIPGCEPRLVTLVDAGLVGTHVICTYRRGAGFGAIDTNGHRPVPDLTPATLCRIWTAIYAGQGYRYIEAVPTVYPFD